MFGWSRIFTLAAVAAAVAIVAGGAGATSTSGARSTSTFAGGAGAASTSTFAGRAEAAPPTTALAAATVSHAATTRKVGAAASRRGMLLKGANLSTRAGVARYLRAIGLDPRGVVIQRSARNYAGPKLPWSGLGLHVDRASGRSDRGGRRQEHVPLHHWKLRGRANNEDDEASGGRYRTEQGDMHQDHRIGPVVLDQPKQHEREHGQHGDRLRERPQETGLTQTAAATAQITQQATAATSTNTACVFQTARSTARPTRPARRAPP